MISDVRLHGNIGPVEYFAFLGGEGAYKTYFYEESPQGVRFFSRGNEFTITEEGLHYKGIGGSFCEYMFGVEKPFKDLMKREIANRLIMFGAFLDASERVVFTNDVEGRESFYRLFLQGHAVKNYYFFVSSDFSGEYKKRQQDILGAVGKFLKRTYFITENMDTSLLAHFLSELDEKNSQVLIFKLIHSGNQEFYKAYSGLYAGEGPVANEEIIWRFCAAAWALSAGRMKSASCGHLITSEWSMSTATSSRQNFEGCTPQSEYTKLGAKAWA
jgi:uncharacterized protein (TIGR04442 family)